LKAVMDLLQQSQCSPIDFDDLPKYLRIHHDKNKAKELSFPKDYKSFKKFCEKMFLDRSLKRYGGRINLTSKSIGMSKGTLIMKIREYEIDVESIKKDYEN